MMKEQGAMKGMAFNYKRSENKITFVDATRTS